MSAPQRIRLSRAKGWRKPEHTVVVARPSRWGNPYRVERVGCDLGGFCYRLTRAGTVVFDHIENVWNAHEIAVQMYRTSLTSGLLDFTEAAVERHLRGLNLACWCQPHLPCHADVLLEIANGGGR